MEIVREEPERAAGIIEGAELALSSTAAISLSAQIALSAARYEQQVSAAITSMGYSVSGARPYSDEDLIVMDAEKRPLGVVVKYQRRPTLDHMSLVELTERRTPLTPLLVVVSISAPEIIKAFFSKHLANTPARIVEWSDEFDNPVLQDSLTELFSFVPPPGKD
jgi:hypothetical protein